MPMSSSFPQNRRTQALWETFVRIGTLGHAVVAVSVLLGVLLTVNYWRRGQWMPVVLFTNIVFALLGNALLTGALSGVFDRY